jgi:hypothetical protein
MGEGLAFELSTRIPIDASAIYNILSRKATELAMRMNCEMFIGI